MSGRRSTFGRSVTSRMERSLKWSVLPDTFFAVGIEAFLGIEAVGIEVGIETEGIHRSSHPQPHYLSAPKPPVQTYPLPILLAHLFLSRPRSFGLARAETSHRDASARPRPKVPDELPCDVASRIPLLAFGSLFTQTRRPLTDTSCSTHNQDYSLNKIRSMASAERPTQ